MKTIDRPEILDEIVQIKKHFGPSDRIIMMAMVGSQAYGLSTDDSDRDYLGIAFGPIARYLGLDSFESKVSTGKPDYAIHELRKFVKLALNANPTILELLYIEPIYLNPTYRSIYDRLVEIRGHFLSKRIAKSYGGYAKQQIYKCRNKVMGHENAGIKAKNPYKHASHCFRLLNQCEELATQGTLILDRSGIDADYLLQIKRGEVDIHEVLLEADAKLERLDQLVADSGLPNEPNYQYVELALMQMISEYLRNVIPVMEK